MVKGRVDKWFGDRGDGFVRVKGKSVFCRSERVVGKKNMEMEEVAWVKVMRDWSRVDESWKAEAWTDKGWEEEVKRRKTREALELAGRAAQVVATSVEKGAADARWIPRFTLCSTPDHHCRSTSVTWRIIRSSSVKHCHSTSVT